jgi:hypothetical protein
MYLTASNLFLCVPRRTFARGPLSTNSRGQPTESGLGELGRVGALRVAVAYSLIIRDHRGLRDLNPGGNLDEASRKGTRRYAKVWI